MARPAQPKSTRQASTRPVCDSTSVSSNDNLSGKVVWSSRRRVAMPVSCLSHAARAAEWRGYNAGDMKTVAESGKARWEQEALEPVLKKPPEGGAGFTTISGR